MSEERSLMLDIKGTFEIAIARNRLRQLTARHHLPLMLQARAAAAITSISELVLFRASQNHRQLQLTVLVHEDSEKQGVEFQFFAPLRCEIMKHVAVAEWQLEQACDEINISSRGEYSDYVIMRLWARRKNS